MIIRHATEGGSAERGTKQHLLSGPGLPLASFRISFGSDTEASSALQYSAVLRSARDFVLSRLVLSASRGHCAPAKQAVPLPFTVTFSAASPAVFPFQGRGIGTILIIRYATGSAAKRGAEQYCLSGHPGLPLASFSVSFSAEVVVSFATMVSGDASRGQIDLYPGLPLSAVSFTVTGATVSTAPFTVTFSTASPAVFLFRVAVYVPSDYPSRH